MIEKDNWKEKVVLITGGCGGVAMATARLYLTEGARVVLADINGKRLSQVASILEPLGGALHTCVSDITHVGDCEATINETVRIFGGLDILINAAGGLSFRPRGRSSRSDDLQSGFSRRAASQLSL